MFTSRVPFNRFPESQTEFLFVLTTEAYKSFSWGRWSQAYKVGPG